MITLLIIFSFVLTGYTYADNTTRQKKRSIVTQEQLQIDIKKKGLKKPVLNALAGGILSGKEISSSAFDSLKSNPIYVAAVLSESGVPKMDIISAGVNAGFDAHVIAKGIKKGSNNSRPWIPVCGNPGGEDPEENPISKVKPRKRIKKIRGNGGSCLR